MNSSTSRALEKQKEQDEIRRQIERLKAQLTETEPGVVVCGEKEGEKKKLEVVKTLKKGDDKVERGGLMLAPNTPSPRTSSYHSEER